MTRSFEKSNRINTEAVEPVEFLNKARREFQDGKPLGPREPTLQLRWMIE